MAVTVNFKTASKRVNSTGIVGGDVTAVSCNINEPCSIENPQIILRNGGSAPSWNYCEISEFGRSYWVEDWEYRNNTWIAHCVVDVLATYRDTIQSTNLYFLRSSTSFDGTIIDNLYPAKTSPVTHAYAIENGAFPATSGISGGCYVLGIVGTDGLNQYYAFTPEYFKGFCSQIFTNLDWADISGQQITENLLKCLFNPFQYVVGCMWFPFPLSSVDPDGSVVPSVSEIKLGWWSFKQACYKIPDKPRFNIRFEVPIEEHPQISRGTFLNSSPFRRITMEINPWGRFEIDGSVIGSANKINVLETIDMMSGIAQLQVSTATQTLHSQFAVVGVPIQISDLQSNVLGSLMNTAGAVGQFATGNFLGSANGVVSAIDSILPTPISNGSNGSMLSTMRVPTIEHMFLTLVDEDRSDNGRPYMKNATMQDLGTGYYVVENGSINVRGATRNEKEQIKQFLEGGVYYA